MLVTQGVLPVRMSRWAHSLLFPTNMNAQRALADESRQRIDAAARTEFELRANRAFTDAEWAATCGRFLKFIGILRDWNRETASARRGNVEGLCQREP
jgi:hypothetical protein